jgi:hypothetical protein
MSDVLVRIKRAVLAGAYLFTDKARIEMLTDGLTELDVVESISTAVAIHKTVRSRSLHRKKRGEKLYVIQSTNLAGLFIYTKGRLGPGPGPGPEGETFYVLISAKRAV